MKDFSIKYSRTLNFSARWVFACRVLFLLMVFSGIDSALPADRCAFTAHSDQVESARLKEEFENSAPPSWRKFRHDLFHNRAQKMDRTFSVKYTRPDAEDRNLEARSGYILYANGNLKSVTLLMKSGGRGWGFNGKDGFSVEKHDSDNWIVTETHIIESPVEWDLSFTRLWKGVPEGYEKGLSKHLAVIESLRMPFSIPIESLVETAHHELSNFEEGSHRALGRTVSATIQHAGTQAALGSITFLPDHDWQVLQYSIPMPTPGYVCLLENEFEIRNGKAFLTRSKITDQSEAMQIETLLLYSVLTNEELREAKARCYLSGYELPDPLRRGSPPYWLYLGMAAVALVFGGLVIMHLAKKGR